MPPRSRRRAWTTGAHCRSRSRWGCWPTATPRADLNDIGMHILRSGLVHSLRMRLRAQEWIRRHPEITEERIVAPIVVVGMMRSGTTLLQRLLAADNRFHCAYGWEVVEVAPKLDYRFVRADEDPRIAISEKREAMSREMAPELFAIHPMYAREPEEEIVFLSDAFLSHVPESGAHVPDVPVVDRRAGLRAGVCLSAPDAAVPAVAEAAGAAGPRSGGCSSRLPTSAISTRCAPSSPTCTSCTCTATRARRSRPAPA